MLVLQITRFTVVTRTLLNNSRSHAILPKHFNDTGYCDSNRIIGIIFCISIGNLYQSTVQIMSFISLNACETLSLSSQGTNVIPDDQITWMSDMAIKVELFALYQWKGKQNFNFNMHSDENCGRTTAKTTELFPFEITIVPHLLWLSSTEKEPPTSVWKVRKIHQLIWKRRICSYRVLWQCDWELNCFPVDSSSMKPVNFSTAVKRFLFFLALSLIRDKVHLISSDNVIANRKLPIPKFAIEEVKCRLWKSTKNSSNMAIV